jgi:hypothetical protein
MSQLGPQAASQALSDVTFQSGGGRPGGGGGDMQVENDKAAQLRIQPLSALPPAAIYTYMHVHNANALNAAHVDNANAVKCTHCTECS